MSLRRTPFFSLHKDAGAKLIDFGGWEMPLQYTSQLAEHARVREAAGLFDVSHMGELRVKGPRALEVVRQLVTNDVEIADGQAQYTCMCQPDGGVVDDLIVYRIAADDYLLCVNASNREKDFQHALAHNPLPDEVAITDESDDWAQVAVQGRHAEAILGRLTDVDGGHARATEQGEIIGGKFGLRGIASRTLEVTLGALLERTAGGDRARRASAEERELANTLSTASRARYRALVHDDPDFPELFKGMTPIDVIERLRIGSRPARRRQMRGVQDLRAIPWVFAWTQCRAVLPGWFGVGSGLEAAIERHGLDALREAARDWPFFAAFLADVEMVLAKSDLEIAARYAELAGDVGARLFPTIRDEHARSVRAVLEIGSADELLERDPTLRRSIRLRNPYVDPLSFVQVDLLRRWRATDREDAALERVLIQTVRGIARGLRNTG